jgi:hypothetical protein
MEQLVKNMFRRVKSLLGVTALSTTAASIACNGSDITLYCVSGNIWVNPKITAVANTTAIKLTAGEQIELGVNGSLSIISDGSGATYQYVIWEV